MKNNKLIICILTLTLILSSCTVCFADTQLDCTDCNEFNFSKIYKLLNTKGGSTSPEESFRFKIEKADVSESNVSFDEMPDFEKSEFSIKCDSGMAIGEGKATEVSLEMPDFSRVGIYRYRISEMPGDTAGVSYTDKKVILTIYVTNCQKNKGDLDRTYTMALEGEDETKVAGLTNTYAAGNLDVKKTVTGLLGDTKKDFDVDVTFAEPKGLTVRENITYEIDGVKKVIKPSDFDGGKITVSLKISDGKTVNFENIPYGVKYSVKERDYSNDGYVTSYVGNENDEMDSNNESVEIVNAKGGTIKTGLIYNTLKYALAAFAIAIMSIVVVYRRRIKE